MDTFRGLTIQEQETDFQTVSRAARIRHGVGRVDVIFRPKDGAEPEVLGAVLGLEPNYQPLELHVRRGGRIAAQGADRRRKRRGLMAEGQRRVSDSVAMEWAEVQDGSKGSHDSG